MASSMNDMLKNVVNEFCIPVTYFVRLDSIIDEPLFTGSFFIGLFLGILLTVPLLILYSKNWAVNKKYLRKRFDIESFLCCRQQNGGKFSFFLPATNMISSSSRHFHQTTNTTTITTTEHQTTNRTEINEYQDHSLISQRGMVDVLMQKNSDEVLEEATKQDIDILEKIEKDQNKEKEMMMLKMLGLFLKEESDNGSLPNDFSIDDFVSGVEEDSQQIDRMLMIQNNETNLRVKKENLFQENSAGVELQYGRQRNMTNRLKREMKKEKIKKLRNRFYDFNIDNLVADRIRMKLDEFNATWDKHSTSEQKRLSESLNNRQQKRRLVAEEKILIEIGEDVPLNESTSFLDQVLKPSVSNGTLSSKRCQELINEFKRDMMRRRQVFDEEIRLQQEELEMKLRQKRIEELKKLEEKHQKEKEKILKNSKMVGNTDPKSTVQTYLSETQKMNLELENKLNELDQRESEALRLFLKEVNEGRKADLQDAEMNFFNDLKTKSNFNQNDVQKMIHEYNEQQKKYNEMCERTRKERESLFKEEMQKQIEEQQERKRMAEVEQNAIFEEQETIVMKMLEDHEKNLKEEKIDLGKKEEILNAHKENMQELRNHLETTRIKQEQNLQVLLAQRRATVQKLREQKDKAAKEKKEEENIKIQEKLNAEIEAAECEFAREKAAAEEKLRQQLREETKIILERQHNELATAIGKLEIAQARRRGLINRQDQTLQCLQEKLENLVGCERTPQDLSNQIVQHHQNVMHHLEQQQRAEREKHERILQAKSEEKILEKKRELNKEFEEQKLQENQKQREKGVNAASSILNDIFMEKRHEENMAELEKEMKAELEKNRRDLDAALEKKLEEELAQQRHNFLVELAAISDLDKDEIKDLVNQAVVETGGKKKNQKKMAQNLTKELEKAKKEFGVNEIQ